MEDRLLELKQQFCNWYCPNKIRSLETLKCSKQEKCDECDDKYYCTEDMCERCMVAEYIRFVRDEV